MTSKKRIKVLVIMGGPSVEHEVSLNTGKQILENLDKKKYIAQQVVVSKSGKWLLPAGAPKTIKESGKAVKSLVLHEKPALKKIKREKPAVVFIAMHGMYGEDGTVQGLLESAGIPYTGSGVLASALGMDKPLACAIFRQAGLLVPDFHVIESHHYRGPTSIVKLGWPLVVKPSNHGSSVGVSIVKTRRELPKAVREAFKYSNRVILQKFIPGKEMTCGVLEDKKGKLIPLPPMKIVPRLGPFYDYRSKYADGGSAHIILPKDVPHKALKKIQDAACRAHSVLGCSGMSRSDFILGDDGKLYMLEINTIPGMTSTSLLPEAAKAIGLDFPKLLDILIANALQKKK